MAQEKAHARVHDTPGAPAVPAPGPTVPVHALLAALAPPIPFQRAFTRSRLRTTAGEGSAAGLLIQPQSSDPTAGGLGPATASACCSPLVIAGQGLATCYLAACRVRQREEAGNM